MNRKRAIVIAVAVAVVLSFLYIWPGIYRYEFDQGAVAEPPEPPGSYSYGQQIHFWTNRYDRLTGHVQKWEKGHWH